MIAALLVAFSGGALADSAAPLHDSTALNIGLNCHWQRKCMTAQQRAMKRALAYVKSARPPKARIHLCNRNAARGANRIDWIGFDNCIHNRRLGGRHR